MSRMAWVNPVALGIAALLASTHLVIGGGVLLARWWEREVIVVTGGSMSPAFEAGDVIVVNKDKTSIEANDVVTFSSNQGLTTHRVVSFHEVEGVDFVRTKGDANQTPDPDLTPASSIVGEVDYSIPKIGHVMSFLSTKLGILVSICPLFLYILAYEIVAIRRGLKSEQEEVSTEVEVSSNYVPRHRLSV